LTDSDSARPRLGTAIRLSLIALIACGLIFPVVLTGFAQVLFPRQANGSILYVNGEAVGSSLIAQNFTQSIYFQPRNDSASGVDPDIPIAQAYGQIPLISNATGISATALESMVKSSAQYTFFFFGPQYVNVVQLNLRLYQQYPDVYQK